MNLMTIPVTMTRTTCPVCGDTDAEVAFAWSARDEAGSRRLVVTEFTCQHGCDLDQDDVPQGTYGPTTVDPDQLPTT
jgi:hypothetical protein